MTVKVDISAEQALKIITVERSNLSIGLAQLFCQNSDYDTLELIQNGINLEKTTTIKILEVKIYVPFKAEHCF